MNKIEKCVFTQPQRCRVITKGTLSKLLFVLIVYFTTIKLYGEMVFNVFENDSLQMVIYEALSCVDDPEVRVVIHDNNIDLGNQFILIDFISSSPVNTKLTLQGCNTQIIFNQNYHPAYDSAIRVLGLSNDPNNQKRLCIDSIDFRYYGADHTKSGIRIWYGLQSFELTNCSFSNMGYGLTYVQGASSPVCNMSISNCTFDQPLGWGPQNNYGFCSYRINYSTNYYSAPDVPIQINLNIFNNTISGIAACGEIELTNVFSTVNIFDNEFSYINPTFSSNMGARELDLHYSGTTLNEVDNAVFNIYNNEFKNWFIYISGCNGTIKWNKFTKTHENYHINYFIDMFPYAANNAISYVNIYKNEFYGCNRFAIHPYNYGAGIGHYNTSIDYNSFFGPGGVMELDSTPEQLNGPQMISSFSNNLIACEGEPINEVNQNVAISVRGYLDTTFINDIVLDIPIEIYRCVFESEDLYVNLSSFTKVGCFTENELYDVDYQNGTYNLTWSHDDKSKAINNGSQIPQFNILSDPDGTPPDIGAIYYPHHHKEYQFSDNRATEPNQVWAMDFMSDTLENGRKFRVFNLIDTFSKECILQIIDSSLQGSRLVRELNQLAELRGLPKAIKCDNGPEFTSKVMLKWADEKEVQLGFIAKGKPTQNGFIESFNGKMRKECLDRHIFRNLFEAKEVIMNWASHYNEERPHRSLNYMAPYEFINAYNVKANSPLQTGL